LVVSVYLHTTLGKETPEGTQRSLEVELPSGTTMAGLLEHLQIELAPEHLLLVANGRQVGLDTMLADGDKINLMPALSGG
jgi:molybdopterin converting factor small subunit